MSHQTELQKYAVPSFTFFQKNRFQRGRRLPRKHRSVKRMQYTDTYRSPLGGITLAGTEEALTGLWFNGQKYYPAALAQERAEKELPVFRLTKKWLDLYFQGKIPDFTPPLRPVGSAFRLSVWEILKQIPYGAVTTYGAIARQIAARNQIESMSAQAVGGAVAHNPISILIPCHRVVGSGGSLTGYAGGIDKKLYLLKLEKVDTTKFTIPAK